MAEVSFPVAGGAGVIEARYENLIGPISGTGRVAFTATSTDISVPLVYADGSGRLVKAHANQAAILRGFRWESGTSAPTVALDANTSGNPRIDLIVLRLERTTFTVRLAKRNGTPSATPAPPAAVQEAGPDGVWEWPVARVVVSSNGTSGLPNIQAANVTPLDYFLAPPPIVCHSSRLPSAATGAQATEYDTGLLKRGFGSNWLLLGEEGPPTKLDHYTGWTGTNFVVQRRNGTTFFRGLVQKSGTSLAANVNSNIAFVPGPFRPASDTGITGVVHGGGTVRALIDHNSGAFAITDFASAIPAGASITFETTSWPSI